MEVILVLFPANDFSSNSWFWRKNHAGHYVYVRHKEFLVFWQFFVVQYLTVVYGPGNDTTGPQQIIKSKVNLTSKAGTLPHTRWNFFVNNKKLLMITGELSLFLSLGTRPTHFFEHMLSCLLPTSPPKANLSSSILTPLNRPLQNYKISPTPWWSFP